MIPLRDDNPTSTTPLIDSSLSDLFRELKGEEFDGRLDEVQFCKPGGVMYVTGARGEKCRELFDVDWCKVQSLTIQATRLYSRVDPQGLVLVELMSALENITNCRADGDDVDWDNVLLQIGQLISQ